MKTKPLAEARRRAGYEQIEVKLRDEDEPWSQPRRFRRDTTLMVWKRMWREKVIAQ